jgi:co-chaperonin GroES (HSP10)
MNVTPLNDNILIQVDPELDKVATESGVTLYKPQGSHEHVLNTGVVLKTGMGKKYDNKVVPTGVEPGDGVLFITFVAGYTETSKAVQQIVGKDQAIIKPNDILLVYDRKNPLKFTQ